MAIIVIIIMAIIVIIITSIPEQLGDSLVPALEGRLRDHGQPA